MTAPPTPTTLPDTPNEPKESFAGQNSPRPEKLDKLTKWVVFGVAFAIAPVLADSLFGAISAAPKEPFQWTTAFEKGELLLVATGIAGAAVGDSLEGAERTSRTARYLAGGGSVLIAVISALLYAGVASKVHSNVPYDKHTTITISIIVFVNALVAGAGCVLSTKEPHGEKR